MAFLIAGKHQTAAALDPAYGGGEIKSQKVIMFISIELQQIGYIFLVAELDKLSGLLESGWVLAVRFGQEHLLGGMGVPDDVEFQIVGLDVDYL